MRTVQAGDVIAGKYVVQGIIGRGGVGIIAAARHVALRQLVALKFLRPEIAADPEIMRRFAREAQAVAQIRSEHVARVMDAGTLADGTVFLVFEHLTGRDLARVLREDGPQTVACAVDYLTQACEAIAEAHALGIVHRDLKPANLFLTRAPDGAPFVKVLDFGLSKFSQTAVTALTALTADNLVIGSPHFMSPEQMRSSRDADARSDIWALGVVLFGLLTGRVPFEGHFLTEVCAAILGGKPLSLRELRPETPPELEAVILRCLRPNPEHRPQSVAELVRALQPLIPAHGQARVARIARVADGARRTRATDSSFGAPHPPAASERLEQHDPASDRPEWTGAPDNAAAHGPSPVSWSISVGRALSRRALGDPASPSGSGLPIVTRSSAPPSARPVAASAFSPSHSGGAHSGRRPLLVAVAAASLVAVIASTLWFGQAATRWTARTVASVVGTIPSASQLVTSVNALGTASEPLPAAPAGSAKPELFSPVAARATASAPIQRVLTPARSATPRRGVESARTPLSPDEQVILGLPH